MDIIHGLSNLVISICSTFLFAGLAKNFYLQCTGFHGMHQEIETTYSSSSSQEEEEEEEVKRNWADLPTDVLSMIFLKLGTNDILVIAQWVCTSWWKLSKQPHLFRSIHVERVTTLFIRSSTQYYNFELAREMAREAIDRSCGELVEFSVKDIANDELLHYMAEKSRSRSLKLLRSVTCYEVRGGGLIEVAKNSSQLEVVEIIPGSYFLEDVFETFRRLCPCLKFCRVNDMTSRSMDYEPPQSYGK